MPRAEADHIDAQRTPTGRRRRRPARGGADAVRRAAAIPYRILPKTCLGLDATVAGRPVERRKAIPKVCPWGHVATPKTQAEVTFGQVERFAGLGLGAHQTTRSTHEVAGAHAGAGSRYVGAATSAVRAGNLASAAHSDGVACCVSQGRKIGSTRRALRPRSTQDLLLTSRGPPLKCSFRRRPGATPPRRNKNLASSQHQLPTQIPSRSASRHRCGNPVPAVAPCLEQSQSYARPRQCPRGNAADAHLCMIAFCCCSPQFPYSSA